MTDRLAALKGAPQGTYILASQRIASHRSAPRSEQQRSKAGRVSSKKQLSHHWLARRDFRQRALGT